MTDLHEFVGLAHFNTGTKVASHVQTVIKIMIDSVKSITNGLNSTTSLNGFFSSSSIVRYIGCPSLLSQLCGFLLEKNWGQGFGHDEGE